MEDWSLQAIVRGSSGDFATMVDIDMGCQDPFLGPTLPHLLHHQGFDHGELLASFPETFEASTGSSDELEDLYKPFYPPAANSPPSRAVLDFQEQINTSIAGDKKQVLDQSSSASSTSPVAMATSAGYSPKYKRRKNQHKRVVIKVSAEGLASDMWAWRKYGQKPIKGSPYPRSYYRCSSSKGCLARKQVEQSCTDPGMFILTYTAEHSHSQPTRRNSLAGTVRQKFPSAKTQQSIKQENPEEEVVSPQKACHHPVSPGAEVALLPHPSIKEESKDLETESGLQLKGDHTMCCDDVGYFMPDFEFNEDFFSGLEEFDDFISDLPPPVCYASAPQLPVRSCT